MSIFRDIEKTVKKVPRQVSREVQHLPKEILDEVPKLVEQALLEAIKQAQKGVLKKATKVLEASAPDNVQLTIGPFGLNINDVHERLPMIKKYANHPPSKKSDIKKMILDIVPSSVTINLSAELALVLVSSESLSLGMTLEWETSAFITRFEDIMRSL